MITEQVLFAAKAFLCWDTFSSLSIQLIPLCDSAAYYYPPSNNRHSIVVFYTPGNKDLCRPFFLLFHEAGHAGQWSDYKKAGREQCFLDRMNNPAGSEKGAFEQEAWERGRKLLETFIGRHGLSGTVLDEYDRCRDCCLKSYSQGS